MLFCNHTIVRLLPFFRKRLPSISLRDKSRNLCAAAQTRLGISMVEDLHHQPSRPNVLIEEAAHLLAPSASCTQHAEAEQSYPHLQHLQLCAGAQCEKRVAGEAALSCKIFSEWKIQMFPRLPPTASGKHQERFLIKGICGSAFWDKQVKSASNYMEFEPVCPSRATFGAQLQCWVCQHNTGVAEQLVHRSALGSPPTGRGAKKQREVLLQCWHACCRAW